jgi:proteasome lid subunit RPN8/RPN11
MLFNILKPALNIPKAVYDEIVDHAKDSYPNECCGVLVGSQQKEKRVFASHRLQNQNKDRAADRYIIDPKDINMIDRQCRVEDTQILGFYHSHPDHPDRPSEYDREWGQAGYSYVIIAVKGGKEVSVKSWTFDEDNDPFREEKMKVNS